MKTITRKAISFLQKFAKWVDGNAIEIIWSVITLICATMAVLLYIISGEIINTFQVFFE
jgi:hypothetical protein